MVKKILIKIGSSLLVNNGNKFNYEFLKSKVREIAKLHKEGEEIIIVSSGAVACGMEIENLKERPKDILKLQLLSGEGQVRLIRYYQELFEKENIRVSQVLLTHHNFDRKEEMDTIIRIINNYLKQKIIPVINENDLVSKEEFESDNTFTDNDILAALVAKELKIDLVLILTDVDGLYNDDPKLNSGSKLIKEVKEINEDIKKIALKNHNMFGVGGMYSKVIAAEMLTKEGIDVVVANGNLEINNIINNKVKRTLFKGKWKRNFQHHG